MKRLTGLLLCVVAALSFGSAASGRSRQIVFGGDAGHYRRERPSSIHLTSDQNIRNITWSDWGGRTAHGSGTLVFSAADNQAPVPLRLVLSHVRRCGKRWQYLRLHYAELGNANQGKGQTGNVRYTCRSPFG